MINILHSVFIYEVATIVREGVLRFYRSERYKEENKNESLSKTFTIMAKKRISSV